MWSTITRLFSNQLQEARPSTEHQFNNLNNGVPVADIAVDVSVAMEHYTIDEKHRGYGGSSDQHSTSGDSSEHSSDSYDARQAKQRASVKWLLSKAYNNRVPEKLREPYYRDHEEQEHLKPQIVHALSNAELYCLALANIYSDPNYHNQNHTGILQALARKGVYVAEPNSTPLTETILIQNSPLKMSAHMAVIEGLMVLYAKEVVTGERVIAAIQRFDPQPQALEIPQDHERGLLLWIGHASQALVAKIQLEKSEKSKLLPELPAARDLQSLCDGVGLAAVVAFYCPGEINWMDIRVSKRPSVADALHNLSLVYSFCQRCLPYPIFHMQPEDVSYMRGSMKQNLVVFLAEMYNVLEIHPAKCVRYPGEDRAHLYLDACPRNIYGVAHKRSLPLAVTAIPDLRSNLSMSAPGFTGIRTMSHQQLFTKSMVQNTVKKSQSMQQTSETHVDERSIRKTTSEEAFVAHRNKGVPTISTAYDDKTPVRAEAAGRPSNWDENRRSTYAGRRSRRNSISAEDSQLTIENFGGSQVRKNSVHEMLLKKIETIRDNIHNVGRNPDKVSAKALGRHPRILNAEPATPARSSIQDAYSSGVQHIIADNGHTSDDTPPPPARLRRHVSLKNILHSTDNEAIGQVDGDSPAVVSRPPSGAKMASFANLSKSSEKGINLTYSDQQDTSKDDQSKQSLNVSSSMATDKKINQSNGNGFVEKKTTFATLPNMTTWQQQSNQQNQQIERNNIDESNGNALMASQLNNIRLKLEEKKRHIENEKRKLEVHMSKTRQKVGKAAFLQAVTKSKIKSPSSSTSGGASPADVSTPLSSGTDQQNAVDECILSSTASSLSSHLPFEKPQRPFSLKEISEDVRDVEHKWLDQDATPYVETRRTPDIENMDYDQYHQSITQMNSSLTEIQQDIQRLASQQNQIQQQHLLAQQHQQMQQQLQQLQSLSQQQQHLHQSYGASSQNPVSARLPESPQSQFYLHDQPQVPRRTWGQPQPLQLGNDLSAIAYNQSMDSRYISSQVYQQDPRMYQDTRAWGVPIPQQKGFVLHDSTQDQRYLNGGEHSLSNNQHHVSSYSTAQNLFNQTPTGSASPQHRNAVHRISQLMNDSAEVKRQSVHHTSMQCENNSEKRLNSMHQQEVEPSNVSYLVNEEDFNQGMRNLNITSGSRTYRIPSPTRPSISRNSFQPHSSLREKTPSPSGNASEVVPLESSDASGKGFYISFDDVPKKPKPSLRTKKLSPKKERSVSSYIDENDFIARYDPPPASTAIDRQRQQIAAQKEIEKEKQRQAAEEREQQFQKQKELKDREAAKEQQKERQRNLASEKGANSVGLLIGNQLAHPDPNSIDEMERKKEKIMLMSLQRRQQQEELKARKEAEAQRRRDEEKLKEEERARKKEEEKARRASILEQYKLKKAIEEAEREGKVIDKELLNALKPAKLRNKATPIRPRPKTIHVDAGADLDSGVLTPSRGKKGSSSNLSTASLTSPTMRRDYYRGSQDSLTTAHLEERRSSSLYRGSSLRVSSIDSPDDGRGPSPSRSNLLGRRGSYKTSRGESSLTSSTLTLANSQDSHQQVRGRPKYPSYQNFKGRKSNSMMNLCDTDSGLGRATPPRRAASPGMGSMRHLPSPSGPGSLPPGLMTKRRVFDDGSSDISSTASSMMDYNGPRLYKQPATKSNRGIMLNAVEYCVFPGTVNRDAKRRVLDEISRSESKHFLILFRDAGCQFRALYSYCPDRDEISKLYGTGPKQVIDNMFDKFFKYNSGGKCFSQVHTKHLTVTIDAFTIHNSLWQGKKVNLPNKKDMALVI
ncbi:patronin isoform X4 [Trichogramma pretiosum]|uniref:patronin isoform X4 n=1 Tax=Trichogramma pretiosum TaxID=7493 RepID=UPI000C71B062|nr:patronin isoform X4 [Trichogramma pretiosum]